MYISHLLCEVCGQKYPKKGMYYKCSCGGNLEIIYNYKRIKKKLTWSLLRKRPFNHWRYKEFFPTFMLKNIVSLGEGGTPLVQDEKGCWLKLEYLNPTGSFKDRGSTLEISHAKELKAKKIICASTGNMGASVAAYSANANLPCEVVLPGVATKEKGMQIRQAGAKRTMIKGDYTKAEVVAYTRYQKNKKKLYLAGDYAYRGEGEKSVGFELADQLQNIAAIFLPIGNGTLLSGVWKGLKELNKVGLLKKLPKIHGVQAKGCNTVVKAFDHKLYFIPATKPKTIASAIACGDPIDGLRALRAIRESKGKGIVVSDREIISARRKLAKQGFDCEPSGAVSYAGWLKTKQKGNVVCVLTGHGLKDLKHI